MTSIIQLTPLSGVMDESPPCYLLEIDDFRILLDTGWNEKYSGDISARLAKVAAKIDAVLLSHSDIDHLGALPYLVGKCGVKCPVYATTPIWKMGQMFLYDCYLNHHNTREFNLFTLDDIDNAMDKIEQVEYNQKVALKGKGQGITITALSAGHTLGGTAWRISVNNGEEEIYYAIDHNNKKERHLNGFEVGNVKKGCTLITNSLNSLSVQEKRRKRDEMLIGVLQHTLRIGGNALIATDTAGRSLELTLMLDQIWRTKDTLANYSLVFLNNVAFNVLEFAKEQIEWMGEKLQKSYENTKNNPFQLRNVVLCHTLVELAQVPSPKVVITSTSDLESGFSRDLFLQWCQDPHNSIVLTNKSNMGTLARTLIDSHVPGRTVSVDVRGKVRVDIGRDEEDNANNNGFGRNRKRKMDGGGRTGVKYVCVTQNFVVNCGVHYIEFEGRSDIEASGRIVQEMEPQKLVLVRGSPEETIAFGTLCQSILRDANIFKPTLGQVIELANSGDVLQVTLSEQLTSQLEFQKLRGMQLAWLDCEVSEHKDKKTDDSSSSNLIRLNSLKQSSQSIAQRPPLFVNKLRLSEFKQIMSKQGIESEYADKVLVVKCPGGAVYIQRHSESKEIIVECDGICDEYYRIRSLLYEQFAII